MNSYGFAPTAPSRPRVYQFHHLGTVLYILGFWQEWEDSNPRPTVLETVALTGLSYTPAHRTNIHQPNIIMVPLPGLEPGHSV